MKENDSTINGAIKDKMGETGKTINGAIECKMKEDAGNKLDEIKDSATSKFKDMKKDAGNAVEDACEKVKEGVEAKDDDC